jgi:hypothetical protein
VKANVKMYIVTRETDAPADDVHLTLVDDMQGVSFQIGEGDAVPGNNNLRIMFEYI